MGVKGPRLGGKGPETDGKGPGMGVRGALHGFMHQGPECSSYASDWKSFYFLQMCRNLLSGSLPVVNASADCYQFMLFQILFVGYRTPPCGGERRERGIL